MCSEAEPLDVGLQIEMQSDISSSLIYVINHIIIFVKGKI